jgi:hypothetical protein
MITEKTLSNNRVVFVSLVQFVIFLSATMLAPMIHNQLITGSIVNAMLFISVVTLGVFGAVLLSLAPSLIALFSGTLPISLAALIPFIMISNIILVLTFNYLKNYNYYLRVFGAALLKFIFLYSMATLIANFLLSGFNANLAITMFSWPQLLTALIGGIFAHLFLKFNKNLYEK